MASDKSIADAALSLAERGYRVFPCEPGGKKAAVKDWPDKATTDPEQIKRWWDGNPGYNIGLLTEGLLVVDIDPQADGSENPWAESLNGHRADFDAAPVVRTHRGTHHYFRADTSLGIRSKASGIAPNVDQRANGGYVIAPPSRLTPEGGSDEPSGGWVATNGLPPLAELPVAPTWLVNAATKKRSVSSESPMEATAEIEEGGRNATLTSVSGSLRHYGLHAPVIEAALLAINEQHCVPPLPSDEVQAIARSVGRYAPGREFADDLAEGGFSLNTLSAEEFLDRSFDQCFYIDGVMVGGEHLIIGGPQKSYKTTIALDAAVSLATGSDFLGHFSVPETRRVLVVSGESGGATLQKTIKRIHEQRGGDFGGRLRLSLELPNLTNLGHLSALADEIERHSSDVVVVDPAYLTLLSAGAAESAGNVFKMGQVLQGYGRIGLETGCTMCLVHHTNKSKDRENQYAPGLASLSQSGFAEWARQWLLVNPRKQRTAGRAYLNMATGGSAGHGGTYHVDINEGQPDDPLVGRRWEVEVCETGCGASEVEPAAPPAEVARRAEVLAVLEKAGGSLSKRDITKKTGFNNGLVSEALEALRLSGQVSQIDPQDSKSEWIVGSLPY